MSKRKKARKLRKRVKRAKFVLRALKDKIKENRERLRVTTELFECQKV